MVTAGVRLPYACVRIRLSTEHPLLSHLGWPAGTDCLCCVGDDVSTIIAPLQHGDGTWIQMVKKGTTEPTDVYRLFMDLRFEFPDGESLLAQEKCLVSRDVEHTCNSVDCVCTTF